jgi:hypothetical protein
MPWRLGEARRRCQTKVHHAVRGHNLWRTGGAAPSFSGPIALFATLVDLAARNTGKSTRPIRLRAKRMLCERPGGSAQRSGKPLTRHAKRSHDRIGSVGTLPEHYDPRIQRVRQWNRRGADQGRFSSIKPGILDVLAQDDPNARAWPRLHTSPAEILKASRRDQVLL